MKSLSHLDNVELFFTGTSPQRFAQPEAVFVATTATEAWSVLRSIEALLAEGLAVAGFISYELAYSCVELREPECRDHARALPYLLLGAFAPPAPLKPRAQSLDASGFMIHDFGARVTREVYRRSLAAIKRGLYAGEYYQINLSVPFDFRFTGDGAAGFDRLLQETDAPFGSYARFGETALLSLSPELFLRFADGKLTTKPMKGTAALDATEALRSPKNRAEHVMIVDLLRNDLSRVCSRVQVEELFAQELHPTFATMTSTITGERRSGLPFHEIIRALFPCGSITGAPKRAAVAAIGELECAPRDAYCGTIGYLLPDGTGEWSVAIRTAQLNERTQTGRLDLGGGIVADSLPDDEWNELEIKGRFFETAKVKQHDRV